MSKNFQSTRVYSSTMNIDYLKNRAILLKEMIKFLNIEYKELDNEKGKVLIDEKFNKLKGK